MNPSPPQAEHGDEHRQPERRRRGVVAPRRLEPAEQRHEAERDRGEHQPPQRPGQPPRPGQRLDAQAEPTEQQRDGHHRHHRREVPQVEGHDPGVEQHHTGPGPRPPHPPGQQRLGGEHDAGLQEAEERERHAGRVGVVHDRPVEADHRHGVRPGPHQRDQSHEPHARQQQPPPGAGQPPVEPRVPELVHGRPHDQVVGEADPERVGRQADQVDQPAEQHPADHRPPAQPLPQPERRRRHRAHDDVRREEPGRHQRHLGCRAQRPARNPRREGDGGGDQPGEQQRHDGHEEATQARPQPPGIRHVAGAGRPPGQRVRVAADEEEDRHHLEDPGERVRPRRELEQVTGHQLAVAHHHGGDQPVAEHDDADRPGPQQVDDAVAGGRGGGREGAHGGEVHATSVARHPAACREYAAQSVEWR